MDSNSVSHGEFVQFHEKFCSISSIFFMCCSLACFLLLHHNKETKRFDDSTVYSELCIVDSHNELSFSLIVFISVLFVGGFLDFGGFLDSIGAVCGGWDNY